MAKMTQAQIDAELKRKASLGIKPTNSANMNRYNQIASTINKNTSTSTTVSKTNQSTIKPTTTTNKVTTNKTNVVAGTGGMTQAQYDAEVKRKQQAGIALTGAVDMNKKNTTLNAIGNKLKPYTTSATNQAQYDNTTSTHIMKQAGAKSWTAFEHGKDDKGTYQIKNGNKVYMNDKNKQYFASNYGGTGNFQYDANNKVTYDDKTQAMRTDSKYDIYGDVGTNSAEKQALKDAERQKFLAMSPEELAQYKANSTSQLEKNFISTLDGTMKFDKNYDGYAPIAIAPNEMQENLQNLVYDYMRQNGIQNYEGMNTKYLDEMINKNGLSGLLDINQVNDPYLLEQTIQQYAKQNGDEASLEIDPGVIMQALVDGGALKEGYTYDPKTGQIGVQKGYVQIGDMLMDEGEATRWYGNQQGHAEQRARQEQVDKQMYEEPLEWRAKYNPESMTDEMKKDLEMERQIKTDLEQLTLQLQYLEQLEADGEGLPMVLGGMATGAGNGSGSGSGTSGNTNGGTLYGNAGNSEFLGVQGGGRSAVYGVSQNYTNANKNLLNAIARRV